MSPLLNFLHMKTTTAHEFKEETPDCLSYNRRSDHIKKLCTPDNKTNPNPSRNSTSDAMYPLIAVQQSLVQALASVTRQAPTDRRRLHTGAPLDS